MRLRTLAMSVELFPIRATRLKACLGKRGELNNCLLGVRIQLGLRGHQIARLIVCCGRAGCVSLLRGLDCYGFAKIKRKPYDLRSDGLIILQKHQIGRFRFDLLGPGRR